MNIIKAINSYGKIFNIGDKVLIYNVDSDRSLYNNKIMTIEHKEICDGGCRAWAIHRNNKCIKVSPKYCYRAVSDNSGIIHSCYCEMNKVK